VDIHYMNTMLMRILQDKPNLISAFKKAYEKGDSKTLENILNLSVESIDEHIDSILNTTYPNLKY
jgi:hypothetical protein